MIAWKLSIAKFIDLHDKLLNYTQMSFRLEQPYVILDFDLCKRLVTT